jgi:hypothetical protein
VRLLGDVMAFGPNGLIFSRLRRPRYAVSNDDCTRQAKSITGAGAVRRTSRVHYRVLGAITIHVLGLDLKSSEKIYITSFMIWLDESFESFKFQIETISKIFL